MFIVGLPRSGTTLIEQILASHPQVHGAGELTLAREDFEAIPGLLDRDGEPPIACIGDLTRDAARRLADQSRSAAAELDGGTAARIVDKMPDNYVHLGLIAALVSERDTHLLPPRLPRHRRFVLVDRLSERPLDERHRAHRLTVSPARAIDESLAKRAARADPPGRLRRNGGRPRGHGEAAGRGVRPGVGSGLSRVPPHVSARPDRELRTGASAGLSELGRPLEELSR